MKVKETKVVEYKENFKCLVEIEANAGKNCELLKAFSEYGVDYKQFIENGLNGNEMFDSKRAINFYEKTIDTLYQRDLLDGRIEVVNHELIHAAVGLGYGLMPTLIIMQGLVLEFEVKKEKSEPSGVVQSNLYNTFIGVGKYSNSFTRYAFGLSAGICFFHKKCEKKQSKESLFWTLMSPPFSDHMMRNKHWMNFKLIRRAKRNKVNPNKKGKSSMGDLSRAKGVLDGSMEINYFLNELQNNSRIITNYTEGEFSKEGVFREFQITYSTKERNLNF